MELPTLCEYWIPQTAQEMIEECKVTRGCLSPVIIAVVPFGFLISLSYRKKRAFSGKQRRITLKVRKSWRMLWGMLRKRMTIIWSSVGSARMEESCCAVMPVLHLTTYTV